MDNRYLFRIYNKENKQMYYQGDKGTYYCEIIFSDKIKVEIHTRSGKYSVYDETEYLNDDNDFVLMQYTGLKDKNGLTFLFEGDIIDINGIKVGDYYENKNLLQDTTNHLIEGMGTSKWNSSERKAIKRGCFYAQHYGI